MCHKFSSQVFMVYFEYLLNFLSKITHTLAIQNNTMEIIHAIRTLRTVCGFLDMEDECYLIFNKNQLVFVVRKSITAQIKKKYFCSFRNNQVTFSDTPLCVIIATVRLIQNCKTVPFTKTENGSVSLIWWKYFAGSFRHDEKNHGILLQRKLPME